MTRTDSKLATVVNVRGSTPFDVYIGRVESYWGNPFVVGKRGKWGARNTEECLEKFEAWMREMLDVKYPWMVRELLKLRGKRLGCWCAPQPCHGDVLVKLIEEYAERFEGRELPERPKETND